MNARFKMYIPQINLDTLQRLVQPGKVIVLYGARRVGKTTLLKHYIAKHLEGNEEYFFVSGDDIHVQEYLSSRSIEKLKEFIGKNKILIIDEAQYIKQIGLNLKLIVDHLPNIQIIASGSSSFDLSKQVGEPLTGRKYHIKQFPLAEKEISQIEKPHEIMAHLDARLIYGSYPEVVLMKDNQIRQEYLKELINSYLFKDILELENIRSSEKLVKILRLIAFQIGNEVSYNELGTQLGMSKNT
ncbi:MAG: ATP-binding protein, partial [Candidatus Celaenobacter polaris]|nr:ATP-binding protein [Candidatus Celaenobacter polaris]